MTKSRIRNGVQKYTMIIILVLVVLYVGSLLLRRPSFMGSRVPEHDDRLLAIVDVSKNRNGATGEVRLNFDGATTRFKDRIETNPDQMGGDMEPVDAP